MSVSFGVPVDGKPIGNVNRVMMTRVRTVLKPLQASLYAALMVASVAYAETPADDVFLQCDGEIRTRQLAFQFGELETENRSAATRGLQIEIRNARRSRIMDHPSGEVLFTPGQCKLSDMKIACEDDKHGGIRQLFISRTNGDAMFEGYSEDGDKQSNLVVEHYVCVKQAREALF